MANMTKMAKTLNNLQIFDSEKKLRAILQPFETHITRTGSAEK